MLPGAVAPGDPIGTVGEQLLRSDFSPVSMDRVVYLSTVGSTAETRSTWITVYNKPSPSAQHLLAATLSPRCVLYHPSITNIDWLKFVYCLTMFLEQGQLLQLARLLRKPEQELR